MRYVRGAYMLVLEIEREYNEKWRLQEGLYVYIGSAWGSGGLYSRVKRHLLKTFKKPHWHIDYLAPISNPLLAFLFPCLTEDDLYNLAIENMEVAIPKFGSTDKPNHVTHLFKVNELGVLSKVWIKGTALSKLRCSENED
ncbi:hypothetical protein EYM_03795 [Ignicoccus islandicus DSM 13165]|uniref:GIY-YIG domain-containing protein n=1 Tax=Ignicoccus islandicus DSM 13165 TaxID=940295 RepID=A0A0U3G042_9CREN|nr:GIY-YIG nuclease family protein [Ignicoccus islandicus]ALU11692.1 hypothetical protein EYM_03795 [Ignicoccus islandicus DSM 13165]